MFLAVDERHIQYEYCMYIRIDMYTFICMCILDVVRVFVDITL